MPSQFFVSGLQYFTYLHAHCKPVEMIMHPGEGHGVSDGETWRDYVERDLAWFDYWLLGNGELPYKPHECHPSACHGSKTVSRGPPCTHALPLAPPSCRGLPFKCAAPR